MQADPPPSGLPPMQGAGSGSLRLLGLPQLQPADGGALPLGPRDAVLLALLVLHAPLARPTLAGWLWPDLGLPQALNNLRQRLFQLNRQAGGGLLHGRDGLALAAGWQHDLGLLPLRWRPGQPLPVLLGGVDLQAWPALADRVEAERARWQAAWLAAVGAQAEEHEAADRLADALAWAAAALQADPGSEQAHRRVMRLHYLRGDNHAALAAYAACRGVLARQTGAAPGAETEALRALAAAGSLPTPLPPATGAVAARQAPPGDGQPLPRRLLPQPQQRAVLRRPPLLVGRDAAWQAMAAAWHAGQAVVLQGPPGVGKSRLADDFARSQGPRLCLPLQPADRRQPLAALARWLVALQPLLPPPPHWALPLLAPLVPALMAPSATPAAPATPASLQQAVLTWLAGWPQAGPTSLVIDDCRCIDSASLQVLAAWLSQHERPPLRLLLVRSTHDDPALADPAGMPWWLPADATGAALLLPLAPLPPAALQDLLGDLAAAQALPGVAAAQLPLLSQRLHQASGGLPGVALDLLRAVPVQAWCAAAPAAGSKPAPGAAADLDAAAREAALAPVLAARLALLPATALRLLRLAALAGAQFDVPLATAVLGLPALDLADDWAMLQDAHWLDGQDLLPVPLRAAVAAGVPPAIRQVLHAQLARALAAADAAPEHCWRHWAAARRWPEAAAAAAAAARMAAAAHMPRAELAAWDAAAAASHAAGDAAGAWQAGLAAVWPALSVEPLARQLQRTADLHHTADGMLQRVDALLARCRVALNAADHGVALDPATQAQQLAQAAGDDARALHAGGWLGLARAMAGDIQPALLQLQACAQAVAGLPAPAGGAELRAQRRLQLDVSGALGYVLHMAGDYQAASDACARAAACAEQLGALSDVVEQSLNLSLCASALGDRPRALQAGEQALAAWRRQGEPAGGAVPTLQLELGTLKVALGQFSAGLPLLQQALAHFRDAGSTAWQVIAQHRLATAWLRLGQLARARQTLAPLPDDASAGGHAMRAMLLAQLARLAQLAGLAPPHSPSAEALLTAALQRHGDRLEALDRRALELQLATTEAAGPALARCDALLQQLGGHPAARGPRSPDPAPAGPHPGRRRRCAPGLAGTCGRAAAGHGRAGVLPPGGAGGRCGG